MPTPLHVEDEQAWLSWRERWTIRSDTTYLNHGSFGLSPVPVQQELHKWQARLNSNPMDLLTRELEADLYRVRELLAELVGVGANDLVLVDNATYAMNVVAESFPLSSDDEVLLTDHEYGAVRRIWQRKCDGVGSKLCFVELPGRFDSAEQVVKQIDDAITPNTKLLVLSHITSPTAVTLPVAEICRRAAIRSVAVCIDGPHAVAQLPLDIDQLNCDFYTASCHKWLSAPLGTGFLYVHPRRQQQVRPPVLSWGKLPADGELASWTEEFGWLGTRDPSALLSIPAAIALLKEIGLDRFRARTHYLARYARRELSELTGLEPLTADSPQWYGAMAHVPLPPGDAHSLQNALWRQFGIEVPIIDFAGRRWIRVSCHLYTQRTDIDRLVGALRQLLP